MAGQARAFVFAVDAGKVINISNNGFNSFVSIQDANGKSGWNYKHVIPLPGLNNVAAGDKLGKIAEAPAGLQSHVHLDRGSGVDSIFPKRIAPSTNPLLSYANTIDAIAPTIDPSMRNESVLSSRPSN
jgi:hypothetical protein